MNQINVPSLLLATSVTLLVGVGCKENKPDASTLALMERAKSVLSPLPAHFFSEEPASDQVIQLGRELFFEKSVSVDGATACVSCHPVEKHAADGLPLAIGNNGKLNARNAPTILNTAGQFAQHWRGDRADVEDQAFKSLTGPVALGAPDNEFVKAKLEESYHYKKAFAATFPEEKDPVHAKNFAIAVGAYERTLVSRSPFDSFLEGRADALTSEQREGLALFLDTGCAGCHSDPLLGGTSFQKFGVVRPYEELLYTGKSKPEKIDHGREDVTKKPEDRDFFKVAPLRNVEKTAPYFHDGSVTDLGAAVRIMAAGQLGKELPPAEVDKIVAFLKSLTGEIPKTFSKP